MSQAITIKVDGLRELGERLTALSSDMAKKVIFKATLAGANVIKKEAKKRAHVADKAYLVKQKSGDKAFLAPPGQIAKAVANKRNGKAPTGTAEYNVIVLGKRKNAFAGRSARLIEFGTVKQSPQPFMRPAFDSSKEQAVQAMKKKLDEAITKANTGK